MKNFIMILLAVLIGGSYVVKAAVDNNYFFPLIFDSSAEPTPTPTETPIPEGEWLYIANAKNISGELWIYAVVPGIGYELEGMKVGKTVYVTAVCSSGVTCELEERPPEYPPQCEFWPGGRWCQFEKMIYPANAQKACGTQYPNNCKDAQ